MKGVVFSFLLVAMWCHSGVAQKKKEMLTTPVTVSYCLPKVAYNVVVAFECSRLIPGPYRQYAEKQLGMKPEIQALGEEWKIKNITIVPQYLPDDKARYAISATGDYHPVMLSLTPEGFLAGVAGGNGIDVNGRQVMDYVEEQTNSDKEVDIFNLNVYNSLKEVLDTNYTFQEIDGVSKKIWDPIERYVAKNDQDNMKEAVREIFRIRSERVKLLSSDNGVADGKSLEVILEKFRQMEDEYLSLFMGKRETQLVTRTFTCVPEKAEEPVVAFRFSPENGPAGKKNVSAAAYTLTFADVSVPAETAAPAAKNQPQSVVYYRIPATAELKLMKGNEELKSFRTIVPQFGLVKTFPTEIISNEGLSLEFYPEYGALKNVGRK